MFEDIVEVQQVRFRNVNEYLSNGYRLLCVDRTTTPGQNNGSFYVKRTPIYIVGRTSESEHYEVTE